MLTLIIGVTIGAVFYPTKRIEERERQKHEEETRTLKEQHSKEISSIQDKYNAKTQEVTEIKIEMERKVTTLTTQVKELKSKQKTSFYKLIKPDGTIEIKKFSETEVDESTRVITQIQEEFRQKIDSIEKKWSEIHKERVEKLSKEFTAKEQEYKRKLDELEKSKVTEINKKSFGVEAGMLLNANYYGHATYDVVGPLFLGLHAEFGTSSTGGAGVGIRF